MADELSLERMRDALWQKGRKPRCTKPRQIRALCPTHNDHNESLVATLKDDRVLVKCHAGCRVVEIVEACGLNACIRSVLPTPTNSIAVRQGAPKSSELVER